MAGSGPAYAAMFIEAMADGGVLLGLPRAQAMGNGGANADWHGENDACKRKTSRRNQRYGMLSGAAQPSEAVRALEKGAFRARRNGSGGCRR